MAIKLKHIRSRFNIQILFTIIFVGALIAILTYHFKQLSKYKTGQEQVSLLMSAAEDLNLNIHQLLLSIEQNKTFNSSNDQSLTNFNSDVEEYEALKSNILKSSLYKVQDTTLLLSDTVNLQIDYVKTAFINLRSNALQRGSANTGLIKNIRKTSAYLVEELVAFPEFKTLILQIKQREESYLLTKERPQLVLLQNLVEELESNQYILEGLTENAVEISSKINAYRAQITGLKKIDKRVVSGITSLEKSYTNFIDVNEHLGNHILQLIGQRFRLIIIVEFALVFLLVLLLVVSIMLFSKTTGNSIKTVLMQAQNLKLGDTSVSSTQKVFYELGDISDCMSSINEYIEKRNDFIKGLLNSSTDITLEKLSDKDMLTETLLDLHNYISINREEQSKHEEENRIRRYINEGLATFGDILRANNDNIEQLCDNFVKALVRYLNAIQGGIFLIQEEEPDYLQLTAAFAYNRKKYLTRKVKVGDGLVGTCAIECLPIYMDDVPEDYINITSGLGDAPPSHVLLLPAIHEGELVGVIEIASLNAYEKHEIDLALQIASNLAATLLSVRYNARTASLLKKSQEQAAEMAEQEEEMRQNMEELQATQEETSRREDAMVVQLEALNNTLYIIEYNSNGVVTHMNEKLLTFLTLSLNEAIGKTHNEIFNNNSNIDETLIGSVLDAGSLNVEETFEHRNEKLKLHHHLEPLNYSYGSEKGVFNIITISE